MPTDHASAREATWELGLETTYGVVAPTFRALPTTDLGSVELAPEPYEVPVFGAGTSEPLAENNGIGRIRSRAKANSRLTDIRFKQVMGSLFQKNSGYAAAGPFTDTFSPYLTSPASYTAYRGYSIQHVQTPSVANGAKRLLGAVAMRMKLSSQVGQAVMLESEWLGLSGAPVNTTRSSLTVGGAGIYMHQQTKLLVSAIDIHPAKWEFELAADHGSYFGTSQTPTGVTLGHFTGKGSFSVSAREMGYADLTALINGTYYAISLEWGTPGTAGHVKFVTDFMYSGQTEENDDGVLLYNYNFLVGKSTTSMLGTSTTAAVFAG